MNQETRLLLAEAVDIRGELQNVSGTGTDGAPQLVFELGTLITSFIGAGIIIGALFALLYMMLGAIQWVTAGGSTGKVDEARTKIMQSIIGLAVLASMYAIFNVVEYFLGIDILGN